MAAFSVSAIFQRDNTSKDLSPPSLAFWMFGVCSAAWHTMLFVQDNGTICSRLSLESGELKEPCDLYGRILSFCDLSAGRHLEGPFTPFACFLDVWRFQCRMAHNAVCSRQRHHLKDSISSTVLTCGKTSYKKQTNKKLARYPTTSTECLGLANRCLCLAPRGAS